MDVRQRLPKNEGAILAALALAAHYFPEPGEDGSPVASFAYASFLLGGHYDTWQAWPGLGQPEKQRIAGVLAAAPEELARPGIFRDRAVKLLDRSGATTKASPVPATRLRPARAQSAIPMVGGDLLRLRGPHPGPAPQGTPQAAARQAGWPGHLAHADLVRARARADPGQGHDPRKTGNPGRRPGCP